ncbi:hypothetical protein PR048_009200 [Dryococelus australis]|uniref:HTH psq-type domain-containing protein n=1 Tax=Dryococelus australis TaxID=614101 RepID=A0ABQ9HZB4_9NEOP|nr:hypothetical protein PR048_009200 [Dryococelus australis]
MASTLSKPARKKWESASMLKAVEAVRNKIMVFLKASKTFGVPRSTLENNVNHKTIRDADVLCSKKLCVKCVLPDELESKLAEYCMVMEERFYGLRTNDIPRLVFQLAARNNVKHPFSEDKGAADKKGLNNFLRGHPSLSLRKAQAISADRAKGFCKEKVDEFYAVRDKSPQLNYPFRVVTAYQVAELMGKAYLRAATIENAVNGFQKCGICPFNPGVFRDSDFSFHVSSKLATESRSNENQGPGISQLIHEESTSLSTSVVHVSPTQTNPST